MAAHKRKPPDLDTQVVPAENPPFWAHSRANKSGPKIWLRERRKTLVLEQWQYGLVPAAIASALGLSPRTVARYLRELEHEGAITVPAYIKLR
jgi:hypothetical protein